MMGRPALAGRPICALQQGYGCDTADAPPRLTPPWRCRASAAWRVPNGVVIVSERYWAFAGVDGSLREGQMPQPPELSSSAAARPRARAPRAPRSHRCSGRGGVAKPPRALADPRRGARAARPSRSSAAPWSTIGGIAALARPALHDPARPRAAPARRGAPRDRRRRGAAPRRDVGGHGQAVALLAALRHELRGARAARHLRRRSRCCRSRPRSGRRSSCSCSRSR